MSARQQIAQFHQYLAQRIRTGANAALITHPDDDFECFADLDLNGSLAGFSADIDQEPDAPEEPHDRPLRLSSGLEPTRLYLNQLARFKPLTVAEQQHYGSLARQGDTHAFRVMIESNLRLVVKVAHRYRDRGVPLLDLIEEGNLGLIHAIRKFEPERGCRFSTYAIWWICEHIERAVMTQTRTVQLSAYAVKELKACLRAFHNLEKELDHEPTPVDIAAILHKPLQQVERLLELNEKIISLDMPGGAEADESIVEALIDEEHADLVEALTGEVVEQRLDEWLDRLTERQREIICRRYGLRGHEPEMFKDIAPAVGIGSQRVREVQIEALRILRAMAEGEGFDVEAVFH